MRWACHCEPFQGARVALDAGQCCTQEARLAFLLSRDGTLSAARLPALLGESAGAALGTNDRAVWEALPVDMGGCNLPSGCLGHDLTVMHGGELLVATLSVVDGSRRSWLLSGRPAPFEPFVADLRNVEQPTDKVSVLVSNLHARTTVPAGSRTPCTGRPLISIRGCAGLSSPQQDCGNTPTAGCKAHSGLTCGICELPWGIFAAGCKASRCHCRPLPVSRQCRRPVAGMHGCAAAPFATGKYAARERRASAAGLPICECRLCWCEQGGSAEQIEGCAVMPLPALQRTTAALVDSGGQVHVLLTPVPNLKGMILLMPWFRLASNVAEVSIVPLSRRAAVLLR